MDPTIPLQSPKKTILAIKLDPLVQGALPCSADLWVSLRHFSRKYGLEDNSDHPLENRSSYPTLAGAPLTVDASVRQRDDGDEPHSGASYGRTPHG